MQSWSWTMQQTARPVLIDLNGTAGIPKEARPTRVSAEETTVHSLSRARESARVHVPVSTTPSCAALLVTQDLFRDGLVQTLQGFGLVPPVELSISALSIETPLCPECPYASVSMVPAHLLSNELLSTIVTHSAQGIAAKVPLDLVPSGPCPWRTACAVLHRRDRHRPDLGLSLGLSGRRDKNREGSGSSTEGIPRIAHESLEPAHTALVGGSSLQNASLLCRLAVSDRDDRRNRACPDNHTVRV